MSLPNVFANEPPALTLMKANNFLSMTPNQARQERRCLFGGATLLWTAVRTAKRLGAERNHR